MLRKYSIHEEGSEPVGYLYYDEGTRQYSVDIIKRESGDYTGYPAILWESAKLGKFHLSHDLAYMYVREHVIPSDRAGIEDILKKLNFPYYDEIFFIDKFHGKNVMDD